VPYVRERDYTQRTDLMLTLSIRSTVLTYLGMENVSITQVLGVGCYNSDIEL